MTAILLAATLTLQAPQLNGEEVVERVRKLARDLGMGSTLRLQRLTFAQGGSYTGWDFEFTCRDGGKLLGRMNAQGQWFFLERQDQPFEGFRNGGGLSQRLEQQIKRWVRSVDPSETFGKPIVQEGDRDQLRIHVPITRNGFAFVPAARSHGISFRIYKDTGEFISMSARQEVPAVIEAQPVLSRESALEVLERLWDDTIVPSADDSGTQLTYRLYADPELGYFVSENAMAAKLVWFMPVGVSPNLRWRENAAVRSKISRDVGDGVVIDAVTGQRVPVKSRYPDFG